MVYLDNAATSFPKPGCVYSAVAKTMKKHGGSPSRSAHALSRAATEAVYSCREAAGELFSCEAESVVLTYNATHALNIAIKGLCPDGCHILISDIEHNSVLRTVHALCRERGCSLDVYPSCGGDADAVLNALEFALRDNTGLVVANHMSNICSLRLPVERIGALCRERGIAFVVDASQSAGHIPISIPSLNADAVCMAGHKGLLGPQGTGLMILTGERMPHPLIYGGTGVLSRELDMPTEAPERFEGGTLSAPLAAGLGAGMRYLAGVGLENIHREECRLASLLGEYLAGYDDIILYDRDHIGQSACVLFNIDEMSPAATSHYLDLGGICTRSGLHCAPLAHATVGTGESGAVRASFGCFNTVSDVRRFVECLEGILSRR